MKFSIIPIIFAGVALVAGTNVSCTPAQVKAIENGIPSDMAVIGCVLLTALDGASLAAIAGACGTAAETAAGYLVAAADASSDAGATAIAKASKIAATPACAEAWKMPKFADKKHL